MSTYNLEMTPQDVGEIIEIIRIQHLKMNDDTFCAKLGIKPSLLFTVEQGKGPHGMMVLKKIQKTFKHIHIGVTVEFR
tara:strand:- start:512 stop:745 length:234 start_codon:yes stop_codon:yes gene_type:complete